MSFTPSKPGRQQTNTKVFVFVFVKVNNDEIHPKQARKTADRGFSTRCGLPLLVTELDMQVGEVEYLE